MPATLDLRTAYLSRRHGDLLAVYTWVEDERALVLLPALRRNAAWFIVGESAAYRSERSGLSGTPGDVCLQRAGDPKPPRGMRCGWPPSSTKAYRI